MPPRPEYPCCAWARCSHSVPHAHACLTASRKTTIKQITLYVNRLTVRTPVFVKLFIFQRNRKEIENRFSTKLENENFHFHFRQTRISQMGALKSKIEIQSIRLISLFKFRWKRLALGCTHWLVSHPREYRYC